MIRGVLNALKDMHDAGWMHRDLTTQNVLILSVKPAKAVITDYGKAIHKKTHKGMDIGPLKLQAPEVDGEFEYSNAVDAWSAGLIICFMVILVDYREYTNGRTKNPNLGIQLSGSLTIWAKNGTIQTKIAKVAKGLIRIDPRRRMNIGDALRDLPEWSYGTQEWVVTSSHPDGPASKKAKTCDGPTLEHNGQWPGEPEDGVFELGSGEDADFLRELPSSPNETAKTGAGSNTDFQSNDGELHQETNTTSRNNYLDVGAKEINEDINVKSVEGIQRESRPKSQENQIEGNNAGEAVSDCKPSKDSGPLRTSKRTNVQKILGKGKKRKTCDNN
ncbi:MAG: hypothetical protein Q9218_005178 [Villophora microphyllina]